MRVLVIGKQGQVARALATRSGPGTEIICTDRTSIDLATPETVATRVRSCAPEAVINAGAYTQVDQAENEPERAFAVNRDGPAALAEVCAALSIPLVHISTDYVFDGEKGTPYSETDLKSPASVYGRSKAEGEECILKSGARAAILRTSWVFSCYGKNFVRTMLRLAESREAVDVVSDQIGRPTWATDVAGACLFAAKQLLDDAEDSQGIFHFAGTGDASWADFAEAIFEETQRLGGKGVRVNRIASAAYPTLASRPRDSRLDTSKFERVARAPLPAWRVGLCSVVRDLKNAQI